MSWSSVNAVTSKGESQGVQPAVEAQDVALKAEVHIKEMISAKPRPLLFLLPALCGKNSYTS